MDRENYKILQVEETATDEEIEESYKRLKAQYNEDKWKDGEEGNNAARMLTRLETAYREVMDERREKKQNTSGTDAFAAVGDAIRSGDLAGAQKLLDGFNERNAEWHYLQSVVFYKKNWINECKKQLEIALQLEPNNEKYRSAYDKLNNRAQYQQQTGGAPNTNPDPVSDGEQMGGNWCATCASMCYTYLCVNCLFNLCCNCR